MHVVVRYGVSLRNSVLTNWICMNRTLFLGPRLDVKNKNEAAAIPIELVDRISDTRSQGYTNLQQFPLVHVALQTLIIINMNFRALDQAKLVLLWPWAW